MPSALTLERVRRDVDVLAHAGLDTATFLTEVFESLQRAAPSDAVCVASIDPATQLTNGAFKFGDLAGRYDTDELWGLLEYGHVEPTSFTELARAGVPAVAMRVATRGDTQRSRRVRELVQDSLGCTDELRLIATARGQLWAGVAMFRDDRAAPYREQDVQFVSSLSGLLARGLRVGLLARLAADPPASPAAGRPAVMIFDADAHLRQASVGAEARLAELVLELDAPIPYAVIGSLVAAAGRYAAGATDVLPSSRLRLPSGEWVVLHASPLTATDGASASVVVTIEEARPPDIVPLVVAAFDLTPRERDVTQLVLQGADTRGIAANLHMSPHTVQDHLKSIFTKTGVSTRRELVARVFFDQYVPRLGGPLSRQGRSSIPPPRGDGSARPPRSRTTLCRELNRGARSRGRRSFAHRTTNDARAGVGARSRAHSRAVRRSGLLLGTRCSVCVLWRVLDRPFCDTGPLFRDGLVRASSGRRNGWCGRVDACRQMNSGRRGSRRPRS